MWSPLYCNPIVYETLIRMRHRKFFDARLKLIARILKGKRVVELGCGTGRNSLFLDCKYKGFDIKKKFVKYGKKKDRNVEVGNVFSVSFKGYDAILMVDILHHLPDHEKLLKKAIQSRKSVIVCEPFEKPIKNGLLKFVFKKLNGWLDSDGTNPHVEWYSKKDLKKMFRSFGDCRLYNVGKDVIAYYPGKTDSC